MRRLPAYNAVWTILAHGVWDHRRGYATKTYRYGAYRKPLASLAKVEVVYLVANGSERIDVGFLVAPKIGGGIIVTS